MSKRLKKNTDEDMIIFILTFLERTKLFLIITLVLSLFMGHNALAATVKYEDVGLLDIPKYYADFLLRGHWHIKYGNWYGPGWWGGASLPDKPGTEPPIDSLDMAAMAHDMAYDEAEKQGEIFGLEEEAYLKAVADQWVIEEASTLDDDPTNWPFPPPERDVEKANFFRNCMVVGFTEASKPYRLGKFKAIQTLKEMGKIIITPEIASWRSWLKRIDLDEFKMRRDKKVMLWISQKEKEVDSDVNILRGDMKKELSEISERNTSLCNSLKEKAGLARQQASNAMQMAISAEKRFSNIENELSQCFQSDIKEELIKEASIKIDILYEQMKTALENSKYFAEICKSENDAEKASREYKRAEKYFKEMDDNFEKVQTQINAVEKCRQIISMLSYMTNTTLSESDKAIEFIEDTKESLKDPIEKQNLHLKSSCRYWTAMIRKYGWSKRIFAVLSDELGQHCKNECDFYENWKQFQPIEAEAIQARVIVRRLSKAIETNEDLKDYLDANLQEIDTIRKTRGKAIQAMSAHSNIANRCIKKSVSVSKREDTRKDCSRERDEYFKRCKTMGDEHISKNCAPGRIYSGCALDVAGCLDAYIVGALPDDLCGNPAYVGCAKGQLNGYLGCLQSCNSSFLAGTINTFGITPCRTECQAKLDQGIKACKGGKQPPAWPQATQTIASTSSPPSAPATARFGPMEQNTDRKGLDYRSFNLPSPDPMLCQEACAKEEQCKAYTYVKPGHQGSSARCWLKHSVPKASPDNHCVSGVKR